MAQSLSGGLHAAGLGSIVRWDQSSDSGTGVDVSSLRPFAGEMPSPTGSNSTTRSGGYVRRFTVAGCTDGSGPPTPTTPGSMTSEYAVSGRRSKVTSTSFPEPVTSTGTGLPPLVTRTWGATAAASTG